ncbi:hypothetical protein TrVE_jg9194 [Triparma verrucosa]|nr:hypothetical protein TrVE_jg9194 [Triparma verrucosa]
MLSILKLLLFLLSISSFLSSSSSTEPEPPDPPLTPSESLTYFNLCATSSPTLLTYTSPSYLLSKTSDSETCLHLLTISPSLPLLTSYLTFLRTHLPPSTYLTLINTPVGTETGLNMSPLSWIVYGLNAPVTSLFLEAGMRVNHVFRMEDGRKVTVLDIVEVLKMKGAETEEIEYVLNENGGKRYRELEEVNDDL